MLTINLKRLSKKAVIPTYAHPTDGALDLTAIEKTVILGGGHEAVGTGLSIAIPQDYVGLICPRSGLALKKQLTVLNAPGIIDCGYTGEIKVILQNHGDSTVINEGDRIAQLLIIPRPLIIFNITEEIASSKRGSNGFGSTGV